MAVKVAVKGHGYGTLTTEEYSGFRCYSREKGDACLLAR